MLAKDPTKRIANAEQVLAALATIHTSPELALSPTLAMTATQAPPRPDGEQVLLSLVMACRPPAADAAQEQLAAPPANESSELDRHAALLLALRALGAQADLLLGGALAVRIPPLGSAKDQAMQAVRAAQMIQEDWPAARIAVVTGRGRLTQGLTTGEAIDRAWSLLSRPASISQLPAERRAPPIWLDDVSAGLVEKRFALTPIAGGGFALGSERMDVDEAQLLLGRPTPCVGRDRELATLDAILSECRDEGVARGVLVLAPPGMGKSRLWHELVRRLESRGESVYKLVGRGDPMKAKASYGLLGEALRGRFGISESQNPRQQQSHLQKWVAAHLPPAKAARVTEFLGELCGVHFPDSDSVQLRTARQDSRIMGDQVEHAWLETVRAMAEKSAVLLILEDLHWADSLTMKLVHAALRELSEQPLMLLLLARPEVQELYPKLGLGAVQQMPLNPLPQKASERLVRLVLGPEASAAAVAQIVEQSSGNPLYLEETVRPVRSWSFFRLERRLLVRFQARKAPLFPPLNLGTIPGRSTGLAIGLGSGS